jgi:hypothetical protein
MAKRSANAQSKQQAEAAQQKAADDFQNQHAEGLDMFQRAFSPGMDARGYSVK